MGVPTDIINQGNKSGRLLANKLNKKLSAKRIAFLYNDQGKKVINPAEIGEIFYRYYKVLYNLEEENAVKKPSTQDIKTFLAQVNLTKISSVELDRLNQEISEKYISDVIKNLKLSTAPGSDGSVNEYFNVFHPSLISHLKDALN